MALKEKDLNIAVLKKTYIPRTSKVPFVFLLKVGAVVAVVAVVKVHEFVEAKKAVKRKQPLMRSCRENGGVYLKSTWVLTRMARKFNALK